MDNLTHSLVGLALAESGLRRKTALATATLVIGANLPDVDALIYLVGDGTDALAFRRGWTHGILAMALWPLLLAGAMLALHRWRARRGGVGEPIRAAWLLMVAAIGIWSHPLLDWFNSYGVRLLMPLSPRWFYGDALFIIDPWVWGLLALGWIWSRRRRTPFAARTTLAVAGCYVVVMIGLSRLGAHAVTAQAGSPAATRTMVGPVPLWPQHREVIRDVDGRYETGQLTFAPGPTYRATGQRDAGLDPALVAAVRATRRGDNYFRWSRFPVVTAEPDGDSLRVTLSDVRYGTGRTATWATIEVMVPLPSSSAPPR
ncbi:MAG: metal-dependent hydrolase [Gemmatimonadales bacterium]|nr:metal-dependent hydrolase [Gemmatimonadales bacterium]